MHRFNKYLYLAVFTFVSLSGVTAAPIPKPTKPAITRESAERVKVVGELPFDVWRIVWGPKPEEVSFLSWGKSIDVLDSSTCKSVRKLGADKKLIHFAVAPDRKAIAWCENSTRVEVQDLGTGKSVVLETKNDQPSIAFSPDGKLLATGGYGTEAKLWELPSGKLVRALNGGTEGGLRPVFSPDGKVLAVGNRNDSTRLYEVATGRLLHELPRKMTQELKFSPDGRTLAVAYVDGFIGLWDVKDGKLLRSEEGGVKEVYTLDWSPKGDVLATAGRDGRIILWEPREMKRLKALDSPEWVIQVRFSPDGTRLFSAGGGAAPGSERKVIIWGLADK